MFQIPDDFLLAAAVDGFPVESAPRQFLQMFSGIPVGVTAAQALVEQIQGKRVAAGRENPFPGGINGIFRIHQQSVKIKNDGVCPPEQFTRFQNGFPGIGKVIRNGHGRESFSSLSIIPRSFCEPAWFEKGGWR